jgi:hypothetical protein
MVIRAFQPEDWAEWRRMRCALWPDATPAEHEAEMRAWLGRPDTGIVVCPRPAGGLCGFAEVSTRPYADGCDTSPVDHGVKPTKIRNVKIQDLTLMSIILVGSRVLDLLGIRSFGFLCAAEF